MTADPKPVKYRNPALLAMANGAPCMHCGAQNGTTVAAHSNWAQIGGKGMQTKSCDWAVAFLCSQCHHEIDQGKQNSYMRQWHWMLASLKTYGWLLKTGRLVVNPIADEEVPY